ncbi:beta-lactamase family protein [Sphingobacteriaceae bacterium WQ 2009]|uniref:Beta-lactamase family protein n=1 Tax=Rhinopithecimicrobium faecis TaxID=2820698 RepID=A0A8T4HDV5_9SPHI|nr:beta-lactamase family protein [Sphingobacteriaceae bacterium WQ 2009]
MKRIFLLLLSAILLKPALAQTSYVQLDKKIEQLREKYQNVGIAIALVKDNALTYHAAYGFKNKELQAPLQKDDIFRIASISKSFTATALMQLVEQGKIKLSDDFGDLVGFPIRNPKFPSTKITLEMVLSHRSSLNDVNGYFDLNVVNPAKNKDWKLAYSDYKPGTNYDYCNLNYNLAGAVLEKFTNTRFDQYIKQQILTPLAVYGGYCVDSLDASKFVTLYEDKKGVLTASPAAYNTRREELKKYEMGYSTPLFSPTGGMKISAKDLATYMMMHMNYGAYPGERLLKSKSAKNMQRKRSEKEQYGLALRENTELIAGKKLIGHTGSAYGLYSAMFFHPKEKFGIVVITNGCVTGYTNDSNDFIREAIQVIYEELKK